MNTLLILPTYNEAENLELFLEKVFRHYEGDILIIDDNSPDGTGRIADGLAQKEPRITVQHRAGKLGLGSAYVEGYQYALEKKYDAALQMDSDFSHDPAVLPELLKNLETADLVLGSRYVPGGAVKNWPVRRLFVSRFGSFYARSILNVNVRDLTGGFKAMKRAVFERMPWHKIISNGYAFQIETTYRALKMGFRIQEIPILFADRTRGKSKISRRVILEAVVIVWKLKWQLS